ncbi:MAG: ABC transporter ATP-binding protein [Deltaproteobacteria bacterium]|nr:ABC transporter ATP-binding protein [Deltaproteobacteria bacterium]
MNFLITIKKVFSSLFTSKEKKRFIVLAAGMMSNGFLEMFSIAAVMPFLGVATNPELIEQNQYLHSIYTTLHFSNNREFLLFLGLGLIGILCLANFSNAFFTWFNLRFVWSVNNSLSVRLIQRYLNQDYLLFIQRNSADLQKNIQTEVTEVTASIIEPTLNLLNKGVSVLLTTVLLIMIDPVLVLLIGTVFGSVYFAVYSITKKTLSRIGLGSLEDNEKKFKAINEALGVFKIAKLLHLEPFFIDRFAQASLRFTRNQSRRLAISQLPRFIVETIAFSFMIGVSLYIIASQPNFTEVIPILGLYVFASYRLMPGIQQIYTNFSVIRSRWAHVLYLQGELETGAVYPPSLKEPEPEGPPQALKAGSAPLIEFRNVTFSYPNTKTATIENISFVIGNNTSVGFMGETGSGKTTIMDLILGIISPDSGSILVQGKPLDGQNIEAWQKSIGYVPQDIYLTDNTIAENIAFGLSKDEIDMDRVRQAAILANVADFIEDELIDQYDTIVGERGVRLSGGQRQRIGIARALYYEPQLVVFDEATSALDNETERSVMEAVDTLSKEKSILIVAHRLTTLQKCDLIIKIDRGKIVKSGTFAEVVEQDKT